MIKFIVENWMLITTTVVAPVLTFFTTRRLNEQKLQKLKSELDASKIANIRDNLSLYQELIDDLEKQFKSSLAVYKTDLEELKIINSDLRKIIKDQDIYLKKLEEKLKHYEGLEK